MLLDYSRLCIHTMTTKPWSLQEAIRGYVKAGVPAITVWRQHLEPRGPKESGKMLRDAELKVVSLARGGFFVTDSKAARQEAMDDNRRAIDEAAEIGAPLIVLVCGALPGIPLPEARRQIAECIAELLPHAAANKVVLSIEPLHPMYADNRSAINTLAQANDIVEAIGSEWLGVTVDVYHTWWDPDLAAQIARAGRSVLSFHVCDWRTPTRDLLNDRGLMGEGCINIPQIREWVEGTGFRGAIEVEIFSNELWATDQASLVEKIKVAYMAHC